MFWIGGRLYTRGSRTWRFNGSKRVSDAVNSLNYFFLISIGSRGIGKEAKITSG